MQLTIDDTHTHTYIVHAYQLDDNFTHSLTESNTNTNNLPVDWDEKHFLENMCMQQQKQHYVHGAFQQNKNSRHNTNETMRNKTKQNKTHVNVETAYI